MKVPYQRWIFKCTKPSSTLWIFVSNILRQGNQLNGIRTFISIDHWKIKSIGFIQIQELLHIPNVIQTAKADEIILITSGRIQNASDVLKVNTKTGNIAKLFTETDEKWIETDNMQWIFRRQLFPLDFRERWIPPSLLVFSRWKTKKTSNQRGNWEVTDFYGFNLKTQEAFIQTNQTGNINKVVAKVNINTDKSLCFPDKKGTHSAILARISTTLLKPHLPAKSLIFQHRKTTKGKSFVYYKATKPY